MNEGNTGSLVSRGLSIIQNASAVTVLFGIVLLCFIWTGLFYKIQAERQQEIAGAFRETANLARAFEEHTLRTVKGVDQTILFLKVEYEKAGPKIDISQYIREGRITGQPLVFLSVIDENGDLAVSSQTSFMPLNLRDREYFFVHKDRDSRELFVSKPVLGRSSGEWFIQLTRRLNKPDGSFGGVVVASVDPYYFTEFYKQVDIGQNASVALVDRDGVVLARETGLRAEIGSKMSDISLMQYLQNGDVGHFAATSPVDGIKRFYSYRALSSYPVVVLVGIDEAEVLGDFNQRVYDYYWGAGAVTAVIVAFVILLLLIAARQKRNAEEIRQARDGLEAMVEKRTQELFAANQELIATNEELHQANGELESEIADRKRVEIMLQTSKKELSRKNRELTAALNTIEQAQVRLIQQEKMAGIGQLAAGVAHEINNPLSFVTVNIETLEKYFGVCRQILSQYRDLRSSLAAAGDPPQKEKLAALADSEQELDLDYILGDFPELLGDTVDGLERMSKIVKGMRLFSRVDHQPVFGHYDLLAGLESTLLVVQNEYKHYAVLEKNLGELPAIRAVGGEINQVLLNLIVNAAHAVQAKGVGEMGVIRLATWADDDAVYFSIADSGTGIAEEHLSSIFNPFFTTKPVGQGTGMGLSISYDIVVNRHHGDISVENLAGGGAKFTVRLPIKHEQEKEEN